MFRRLIALCACVTLIGGVAASVWWWPSAPIPAETVLTELPIPPFPPRITEGSAYEACLATLSGDPISAVAMAETWQADGGGDGALHCRGLALIAMGNAADGAALLEQLSQQSNAPAMARANVLGQAAEGRQGG